MKTAWFILKFVALTVPLTLLWKEWGRGAYGGVLHDVSGTIYRWFGLHELQPHGPRDRYINYIPFIALMLVYSLPFVWHSWALGEISQSPGGLPYRWLIKAVMPFSFGLLLLAVWSRLTRVWVFLFGASR